MNRIFWPKNKIDSPTRTNSSTIGGGGLEWGAWFEFTDKDDRITNPSLAFLVDIFQTTPNLLPRVRKSVWQPVGLQPVTLSIEFKNKILTPSSLHADRTVGLYCCNRFMIAAYDAYVEVWTAPSNIGEGRYTDNWRDNQSLPCHCYADGINLPHASQWENRKGEVIEQ